MPLSSRAGCRAGVALTTLLLALSAHADSTPDLTSLSFDDLLDLEITSVSKRAQPLSEAAAAVYVITDEDLRHSGATSVPEALRMVPGIQVAQLDANKWAVSARGFGSRFANKLLVLVDGRTVYTPGFSGVYWEQLDVPLADIERIEVIRGPGATLWGANAVNGVVNVITKPATATRGGRLVVGAGTEERAFGTLRYGARLGQHADARVYLKYAARDASVATDGVGDADDGAIRQGGFRVDAELPRGDRLTLQGDVYAADLHQPLRVPTTDAPPYFEKLQDTARGSGWNLLGRWERPLSVTSEFSLQLYTTASNAGKGSSWTRPTTPTTSIFSTISTPPAAINWSGAWGTAACAPKRAPRRLAR